MIPATSNLRQEGTAQMQGLFGGKAKLALVLAMLVAIAAIIAGSWIGPSDWRATGTGKVVRIACNGPAEWEWRRC